MDDFQAMRDEERYCATFHKFPAARMAILFISTYNLMPFIRLGYLVGRTFEDTINALEVTIDKTLALEEMLDITSEGKEGLLRAKAEMRTDDLRDWIVSELERMP